MLKKGEKLCGIWVYRVRNVYKLYESLLDNDVTIRYNNMLENNLEDKPWQT